METYRKALAYSPSRTLWVRPPKMISQFVEQLPGQFYEMINDMMFVPLMKESISMFSAGGPVFLYQFDYNKRGLEFIAPYHSMDLTYLVGIHNFTFDSRDSRIREIYSKLFAEFAKSGNPTPKGVTPQWLQLQKDSYNFYSVDLPNPQNEPFYNYPTVEFWVDLGSNLGLSFPKLQQEDVGGFVLKAQQTKDEGRPAFWVFSSIGMVLIVSVICVMSLTAWKRWQITRKYDKLTG